MDNVVGDVAKAVGDAAGLACAVFQKALTLGIDVASMAIPGAGEAAIGTKVAITAAKKGLKAGGKAGMMNMCGSDDKWVAKVDKYVPI
jgi:hypothetical protein